MNKRSLFSLHLITAPHWLFVTLALVISPLMPCCAQSDREAAPRQKATAALSPTTIATASPSGYAIAGDSIRISLRHDRSAGGEPAYDSAFVIVSVLYADNRPPEHHLIRCGGRDSVGDPVAAFTIPPQACYLTVYPSNGVRMLPAPAPRDLPVMLAPERPARNAALQMMQNADTASYHEYFETERRLYPDNMMAYAAKWNYQFNMRLLAPDTIVHDLAAIERLPRSLDRDVVLFIGYALTRDGRYREHLATVREMKGAALLNDWNLAACLGRVFIESAGPSIDDPIRVQLDIVRNNPGTEFTKFRMQDFMRHLSRFPAEVASACDSHLMRRVEPAVGAVRVHALLRMNGPASERLRNAAVWLDSLLGLPPDVRHRVTPIVDYTAAVNTFLMTAGDAYLVLKEHERAERVYRNALTGSVPFSPQSAFAYQRLGHLYRAWGRADSAIINFGLGYHVGSRYDFLKDSIWNDLVRACGGSDSARAVAAIAARLAERTAYRLPEGIRALRTLDGREIDLSRLERDVIIEFTGRDCPPCHALARRIAARQSAGELGDVDVVLVGREDEPGMRLLGKKSDGRFELVAGAREHFGLFNVVSTPVLMRVTKGGRVVYRIDGDDGGFARY